VHGKIIGPGNYERPKGWSGVAIGEGEIVEGGNQIITTAEALEKVIGQLDSAIETAEKEVVPEQAATVEETEIDVLPGFPEKLEGEILFLDADNISTDAIYPGMYFLEYFVAAWHRSWVQKTCPWEPWRTIWFPNMVLSHTI
jgi:homoaconitate hydratase